VKVNQENTKERKFPHVTVVGLSKYPRKATKTSLKALQEKVAKYEGKAGDKSLKILNRLKKFGVFVKTYNMSHLLATRYRLEEDFSIQSSVESLENLDEKIKETTNQIKRKEGKEENEKEVEEMKKQLGQLKDDKKKVSTGFSWAFRRWRRNGLVQEK
jgi:hypothetical protein